MMRWSGSSPGSWPGSSERWSGTRRRGDFANGTGRSRLGSVRPRRRAPCSIRWPGRWSSGSGFRTAALDSSGPHYRALLEAGGLVVSVLIVTPWGQDLSGLWRDMVRHGLAWAARWCLCVSGPVLRVTDSQRTYARRFAEIDLQSAAEHDATFAVLWGLLRAAALAGPAPSVLDRAVAMSDQHRVSVRNSLQQGVEEALTRLTRAFLRAQHRRLRTGGAAGVSRPVRGRIAGHHLSRPVPPVRGGARAGPEVASGLS